MTKDDIEKVWLTDTAVWIRTKDGHEAFKNLSCFLALNGRPKSSERTSRLPILVFDGRMWMKI